MQKLLRWLDPLLNPEACLPPAPMPTIEPENADALLKRLDLLLRQKVRFALTGERRSKLKGQGLDFSGLREYNPGDDIRKMDWSVFARTLSPYVREYQEEKQLTLWLAVDMTPSMQFGRNRPKAKQAIEIAGLMGLLAQRGNHKLGGLLIEATGSRVISPKTGPAQTQHIVNALLQAVPRQPWPETRLQSNIADSVNSGEPLADACRKLGHVAQKQNTVIFLSDFIAQDAQWQASLGELSRRAQLLCLMLADPVEQALPAGLGLLNLKDLESGQTFQIDTNDAQCVAQYQQQARLLQEERLTALRNMGLAALALTEDDPLQSLLGLLNGQGPS